MSNHTIYFKDYQPPCFAVKSIHLNFDLYDDHALVNSEMVLYREHSGVLRLHGDGLELVSVKMNGENLSHSQYAIKNDDLIIDTCPDELTLQIQTKIYPQKNTELSGLYRSKSIFCTQCEAEGFRRITFFPDRPDVLTVYTTRISAEKSKYPVLLSNGNLIAQGDGSDGRHWAEWHDPFKKPSYLFALVAGNLACVQDQFITVSGRQIDLRIYVEPGQEDKCAYAMLSLKEAMRWDEAEYGREYDLDIFMIVAVSDFNMGAMENKGLNIFNAKYILARPDTATDLDFADIEGVVGHEYFHNWTGNRITCRDWFQLSLKEGLTVFRDQEFSRDMNSRDVNRIMDVRTLLIAQYPEDAGSMAHPVRPASYEEINNFYTATIYNKGAEVIRMQQILLGQAGFRQGMDLYFLRHDGQAVTIDDFVRAMEDANQRDLTQFKRWYSQAGTPVVEVLSQFESGTLRLIFKQTCRPTAECQEKQPFHIPIQMALFSKTGDLLTGFPELLELNEATQSFEFPGLSEKPYVSLLRDFSAPIILNRAYDEQELLALLQFETNGYAKWDAARQLVLHALHHLIQQPSVNWLISPILLQTFTAILKDTSLDQALKAELLSPPSFEEVIAELTLVDVERVEAARDFYVKALGLALFDDAKAMYDHYTASETHALDPISFARRKIKNTCLSLMMRGNEAGAIAACQQQLMSARTMTDQITSFTLLTQVDDSAARQAAIQAFYRQWAQDELVMDKWFTAQAMSPVGDTLQRVRELLTHPAYSHTNPNKVRALVGAFVKANPRHFHAVDGSGYAFLTEQLLSLDKINASIAAGLARPFTVWQRYDEKRQQLMQQALAKLAAQDLSRDLRELVSKSIGDA